MFQVSISSDENNPVYLNTFLRQNKFSSPDHAGDPVLTQHVHYHQQQLQVVGHTPHITYNESQQ